MSGISQQDNMVFERWREGHDWLLEPFGRFFSYVTDLQNLTWMTMMSLRDMGPEAVEESLSAFVSTSNQSAKDKDILVGSAKDTADLVRREIAEGYPTLAGRAIVDIWGAIEVLVTDVVVTWLQHEPRALQCEAVRKIQGSVAEFIQLDPEARAQYLRRGLEQAERQRPRQREGGPPKQPFGYGRFQPLLEAVDLGVELPKDVMRDLVEIQQIRNVTVHHASIADEHFVETCKHLNLSVGDRVRVSAAQLNRYQHAAFALALRLVARAAQFYGVNPAVVYSRAPRSL